VNRAIGGAIQIGDRVKNTFCVLRSIGFSEKVVSLWGKKSSNWGKHKHRSVKESAQVEAE